MVQNSWCTNMNFSPQIEQKALKKLPSTLNRPYRKIITLRNLQIWELDEETMNYFLSFL